MSNRLKKLNQRVYENQKLDLKFSKVTISNNVKNFEPVETLRNGNCLYNSISLNLYGSEDNYFLIKIGTLFILFQHEAYFRNIMIETVSKFNFEKYIEYVAFPGSWGDELSQVAISILLDRPLYVFSCDPIRNIPYSTEVCVNANTINNCSINIGFMVNHFVALMPKNNQIKPPKPKSNHFIHKFKLLLQ